MGLRLWISHFVMRYTTGGVIRENETENRPLSHFLTLIPNS